MLMKWILIFLTVVIITLIIGFTGIATQPLLGIARTIFTIFLVLFVVTVFIHISSGKD
jgi:uncharacterized membrane protein YtjA (UPF0391 family)